MGRSSDRRTATALYACQAPRRLGYGQPGRELGPPLDFEVEGTHASKTYRVNSKSMPKHDKKSSPCAERVGARQFPGQ